VAHPQGDWGTIYQQIFTNLQGDGLGGAQTGPLAFIAVHDTVANGLAWLGLNLENRIAGAAGPIAAAINPTTNAARDTLLADAAAKFGTLHQQLVDIAGGAGNVDALIPSLAAIRDTIGQLVNESALHPADADADAVDNLNADLVDVAFRGQKQLKPILEAFDLSDERIGAALDAVFAGEGGQWVKLLPRLFQAVGSFLWGTSAIWGPALMAEVLEHFPALAARFKEFGEVAAEHVTGGITALHRPLEAVIETGAGAILRALRDEMFNLPPATPENVDANASRLLSIAGGFGMSAHLVAIAAEKIVGAKHLGFPQLAAYLADAASFGAIARSSVGVQIEAALQSPARRRALAQFRPELMDTGSFLEVLFARSTFETEGKEFFRQRGWTENDISRFLLAVFRKASPREMAMVFEDGEIDEAWGLKMLQRHGFNDEDADRLLRGVITRAGKTARQALITAVMSNADDGVYDPDQAAGFLRGVGLSESNVERNLLVAAHKRLNAEVKERTAALVAAHLTGATTEDELLTAFSALGLDDRARLHHLSVARIKRGAKVFTTAEAKDRASEERARRDATDAALAAFRRFVIDEEGLRQTLLAIGVHDQEVDAVVQLAAIKREPEPKLQEVLSAGAELQRERNLQKDQVLELQKKGQLSEAEATDRLTTLGFPRGFAVTEAALVAARLVPPADVVKPPTATELERERQRDLESGALDLFRAGLTDQVTLRGSLISAGRDAATADAIVVRESDRAAAEQHRASRQLAGRELALEQQRVEREAIAAFRSDLIDADGLEQTLIAAGRSTTVAHATAQREVNLQTGKEARQQGASPAALSAKVLTANQDAAVLAFRHHILTADELEEELVNAGVDPVLAAAIRRREEIRAVPTPRAAPVPVVSEPAP